MPTSAAGKPGDDAQLKRSARRLPRVMGSAMRLVWAAAPRELLFTIGLQVIGSIGLAAQLLVGRHLLSRLLAGRPTHLLSAVLPQIIWLTVALAVVGLANLAKFELRQLLGELVSRHAFEQVTQVATELDLLAFEDSRQHDRLQRALLNAATRPLQMATGVVSLIGSVASSTAIGIALFTIQPILCLLAILGVVPFFLATLAAGRALYRFGYQQTERDRRRLYLQFVLTQRDSAKEVRAYRLSGFLRGQYSDLYRQRMVELRRVIRLRLIRGAASAVLTAALGGFAIGLLAHLLETGSISLASAGAAAGALLLWTAQLQGLAAAVGALYESSLFVQDFTEFVDDRPRTTSALPQAATPARFREIRAAHVTFTYPNGSRPALRDVSVRLPAGRVVALVGENGSGKSTLSKILAGLYAPGTGVVTWDGVDFADYDPDTLRDRIAVLFQDFVKYQLSASENISLGQWQRAPGDGIAAAAKRAGADEFIRRLSDGYSTQLGPEFFGGVDLSGGQWQRIAFARAIYRDAPLVVLDEPTAALDARSESELFATMGELFEGRTVLLTSHRFASVRLADYIYVLDDGAIVEEGIHSSLMANSGLYADLYNLQAATFET